MLNKGDDVGLPAVGQGKRGMQGHLGYLLRQANVAFRQRMERALADLDLTQPQFALLTMVAAYPGVSNADLARLTLLTPQTVSVTVANLKRQGYLVSQPHDIHGRIRQLTLTKDGQERLGAGKQRVAGLETDLAAGLGDAEMMIIRRWLVQVATNNDSGLE